MSKDKQIHLTGDIIQSWQRIYDYYYLPERTDYDERYTFDGQSLKELEDHIFHDICIVSKFFETVLDYESHLPYGHITFTVQKESKK